MYTHPISSILFVLIDRWVPSLSPRNLNSDGKGGVASGERPRLGRVARLPSEIGLPRRV